MKHMSRVPSFALGVALVCVGFALCGHYRWVRTLWYMLSVGFTFEIGRSCLMQRGSQRWSA